MAIPAQPADLINRSLDAIGTDFVIGSLTDGTNDSERARRIYGATLRQLLRAASWSFARKQAPLLLLGDASGNTLDPQGNPISTNVEPPWLYAYAWPSDGLKARWLPWNQIPPGTAIPPMPNLNVNAGLTPLMPAPFLISSSAQFPLVSGQIDWDDLPDFQEGEGLLSRRVVLTNVPSASLVYTKLSLEIEEWDPLFAEAMVALIASRLAMAVIADKKLALTERAQQIAIAKEMIREARVANANDAGFPQSVNHDAIWIRARVGGTSRWGGGLGDGPSYFSSGWDAMSFADGSVM